MQKVGKVIDTFSAIKGSSGMPRPRVEELKIIEGLGIENDKFSGKDLNRTVMIVGLNTYELAKDFDMPLEYGSLGENILLDFDPHLFEIGTILSFNGVKIQITEKCTICSHLAVFGRSLPKLVKDCRGLYCKVLSDGIITKNTQVLKG